MAMRLGIDTGGTFTDFVLLAQDDQGVAHLRTRKILSTPEAPERAILQGLQELGLADALASGTLALVHGSTVATNAALEGKGVRTAFITNTGFADLLTIARQTRPHLYRLQQPPQPVPVPSGLCLEMSGRIGADGVELEAPDRQGLARLADTLRDLQPEAVAICQLFAFLNPAHELEIAAYLRRHLPVSVTICCSSGVLPEYREYERGIATWLNASLGPLMQGYLNRLHHQTRPCPLAIMQSSGGTISADQAAGQAVRLLLSGPAGGLAAVRWLADATGCRKLLTFDMGGTSTDVALFNGEIGLTNEGHIGGWPVAVPMVDMHTIGAGGGSLAWIDAGGLLQVGPRSAGAQPGPACYGLGGTQATVTDANLLLGRLRAELSLGAGLALHADLAALSIEALSNKSGLTNIELAQGIIRLANEHMAQALRVISVSRGHDPREFTLCCFGGAGGLHVCALAEELDMREALVPAHGGVLSALGMLLAPAERQYSQSILQTLDRLDLTALKVSIELLESQGLQALAGEGHARQDMQVQVSADLRYRGQSATLTVDWRSPEQADHDFQCRHEERYRHRHDSPVELVNLRVAVSVRPAGLELPLWPARDAAEPVGTVTLAGLAEPVSLYQRDRLSREQMLTGPCLICESNATTYLATGWSARVDMFGNLKLTRSTV